MGPRSVLGVTLGVTLGIGLLIAAAAIAWLMAPGADVASPPSPARGAEGAPPPTVDDPIRLAGTSPRVALPATEHERIEKGLRTQARPALQKRALDEILAQRILEPRWIPLYEACVEGPDAHGVPARAMVALMRTEGSRRYVRQLAAQKSAYRLMQLDPETGHALHTAWQDKAVEGPGQDAAARIVDVLVDDPDRGREALIGALRSAADDDDVFYRLLALGVRLRPVPRAVADLVVAHVDAAFASGSRRHPMWGILLTKGLAWEESGCVVAESILPRIEAATLSVQGAALRSLGLLRCAEPAVLDLLVRTLATPAKQESAVLQSILLLAEDAPFAAEALLGTEARVSLREDFAAALLRMNDAVAVPYLRRRLAEGEWRETTVILRGLPGFDGAAALLPDLAQRVRRIGDAPALAAVVRIDPALEQSETVAVLHHALESTRYLVRKTAVAELALTATHLPDDLFRAALARVADSHEEVRAEGVRFLRELGRFGPAARAWVDALLAFESSGPAREDPRLHAAVLGTLGEIDGDESRVRTRLFAALEQHMKPGSPEAWAKDDVTVLEGALYGLAGVTTPTPEEYRAVAQCSTHNRLFGLSLRVRGCPGWDAVRQALDLKLASEPRIRPATWRHPRSR